MRSDHDRRRRPRATVRGRAVRSRLGRPSDAGTVTAETAVAMPAMVLLAAMLIWGVVAAAGQIRCVDAARIAARAAARGDTDAVAAARAAAPPGASVEITQDDDTVRVTVEAPFPAPGRIGAALSVRLGASAVAAREDAPGEAGGGAPWPS